MSYAYRKAARKQAPEPPAPKPEAPAHKSYGAGVAMLAAKISGCSIWTVYKVLHGSGTSARASRGIEQARRQLAAKPGKVAAA